MINQFDTHTQNKARYAILRHLMAHGEGFVTIDVIKDTSTLDPNKNTMVLKMDKSKIKTVGKKLIGNLLKEIHVARSTADVSLSQNFQKLTEVEGDFLY